MLRHRHRLFSPDAQMEEGVAGERILLSIIITSSNTSFLLPHLQSQSGSTATSTALENQLPLPCMTQRPQAVSSVAARRAPESRSSLRGAIPITQKSFSI